MARGEEISSPGFRGINGILVKKSRVIVFWKVRASTPGKNKTSEGMYINLIRVVLKETHSMEAFFG